MTDPGYADMATWMRGIERRLDLLSQGNQVTNGTIVDPDTGKTVALHSLAFGQESVKADGTWSNNSVNQGSTFYGGGPDVLNVPVRSGRLIVVHSAHLQVEGDKAAMTYSSRIQPAAGTTGLSTELPLFAEALQVWSIGGAGVVSALAASYWRVVTGLVPGVYDVLSAYNCSATPQTLPKGAAITRSLTVIPF